ncbi:YbaB/EbfC family nucleoid-associated protein [Actinopolymorpha pittospori]
MGYFGIPELDDGMDGLLGMVDKLDSIQRRLGELTATATSDDEYIEVTVDAQGDVQALKLNPRIMRSASEDLAEGIKDAVNRAQAALRARTQELMAEVTSGVGLDLGAAVDSAANVKEAAADLIRIGRGDVTPEEATATMKEATRKVTGLDLG